MTEEKPKPAPEKMNPKFDINLQELEDRLRVSFNGDYN